jgi:hypothetical protein
MAVPPFLPWFVIAGSVAMIASLLLILRRSLRRAEWPEPDRVRALRTAGGVLIGWFVVTVALGAAGAFRGAPDSLPTIQYGLFVPVIAGVVLLWRSVGFRRLIDAVPQHLLVGVQLYRALGVVFLILLAMGKLPGLFAWPAGTGDLLVGIFAPVVGVAYLRSPRESSGLVWVWNVIGLADLAVAVSTGFLTSPSPLQRFALEAPNDLISAFPLILVPTFLVPVSIVLHVASLKKLHEERSLAPVQAIP